MSVGLRRAAVVAVLGVVAAVSMTACNDGGSTAASASRESPSTARRAPATFADAVRARDLDAIMATFADDIELYSPVLEAPFVGKQRVSRLFGVLVNVFRHIEITAELASTDHYVLAFRTAVGTEPLQVVDLLTFDAKGKIETFVVTTRTLAGTQALAAAVAPHLAAIG